MRPWLPAFLLLVACPAADDDDDATPIGDAFETHLTLLVDPDHNPLDGAASLEVTLWQGDTQLSRTTVELGDEDARVPDLDFAEGVVADVAVLDAAGDVVGLGRSQPFGLGDAGAQAGVFLGPTDRIARVPDALYAGRTWAQAARADNGRVVVVGGGDGEDDTIGPVEFVGWDPLEPTMALRGQDLPRIGHGIAYVAEGEGVWGGKVVSLGGTEGTGEDTLRGGWNNAFSAISLIDPVSGVVEDSGEELASAYMDFRLVPLPGGELAMIGGYNYTGSGVVYTNTIPVVDPAEGRQTASVNVPNATNREQHAALTFEADGLDFVYVAAGFQAIVPAQYQTRDLLWSGNPGDAPVAVTRVGVPDRARHTATDMGNGRVLVAGGAGGMTSEVDVGESLDSAEVFIPGNGTGTYEVVAGGMTTARQRHVAFAIPDDRILICGGQGSSGGPHTSCEVFDVEGQRFDPLPDVTVSPGGPGMTAVPFPDGRVFLFGGATDLGPTDAMHIYTPPRWQDR